MKDAADRAEGRDGDGNPVVDEVFATWVDDEVTWRLAGDLCAAVAEDAACRVTAGQHLLGRR